jgi:hypothetical protein
MIPPTVQRETYAHDVTSLLRGRWLLMAGPSGDVEWAIRTRITGEAHVTVPSRYGVGNNR